MELYSIEGAGHGVSLSHLIDGQTLYEKIARFLFIHLDLKD